MDRQSKAKSSAKSKSTRVGATTDRSSKVLQVFMADDDRNEQLLTVLAAEESNVDAEFTFVDDGSQLLVLLNRRIETGGLPDLIVLDLRMPVLDGHRTLLQLQSHPTLGEIPVIAFSSSTRAEDRDRSLAAGARWFETKPSEFSEMIAFIQSLPERALQGSIEISERELEHVDLSSATVFDDEGFDELSVDDFELDLRDGEF